MQDASPLDAWSAAHVAWRRPTLCPACASRPASPTGLCVACTTVRRDQAARDGRKPPGGVSARTLAAWNRPPAARASDDEPDPALEELADRLAVWLASRPPACPRCAAPTATLEAEPCPSCVAQLEAEREALRVAERARQLAWWHSYGPAWRAARRAAREG